MAETAGKRMWQECVEKGSMMHAEDKGRKGPNFGRNS